jgi:hypothetical protein
MKTFSGFPCIPFAIIVLVVVSVLFAGCNSQPAGQPAPTQAPVTIVAAPPVTVGATGSVSLPYGVSITVPATWTREDIMASGIKDYGRTTTTISWFSSPATIPGDMASMNSLTVDIDQNPGADFEAYFNQATLAVEKSSTTQTNRSLVKSSTLQISGYKSYEPDFQNPDVKGSYIFTSTEKGMYIFSFLGKNEPVPVHALEGDIVDITKSIKITPSGR